MVKYETFNLCYMGSIPIGLNLLYIIIHNNPTSIKYNLINGYRLMVDLSSSKRFVSIRIRLAVIYHKG